MRKTETENKKKQKTIPRASVNVHICRIHVFQIERKENTDRQTI